MHFICFGQAYGQSNSFGLRSGFLPHENLVSNKLGYFVKKIFSIMLCEADNKPVIFGLVDETLTAVCEGSEWIEGYSMYKR